MKERLKQREYKSNRIDTAAQVAEQRLQNFEIHREEVLEYYSHCLETIDSSKSIPAVRRKVNDVVQKMREEWNITEMMNRFPNLNILTRSTLKGQLSSYSFYEFNRNYMDEAIDTELEVEPITEHKVDHHKIVKQMDF